MRRRLLFKLIKFTPSERLTVFIYRRFFKYKIGKNTRIGKSVINCRIVEIGENVIIRNNNIFSCHSLLVGNNTHIHSGNIFRGQSSLRIGNNSRIINNHYFDLSNYIEIGNFSWIAGRGSQFWTHGSTNTKKGKDLSITIKDNVYVGSNSLIAPGVTIDQNNLIGLGSVVTSPIRTPDNLIAGNPAQVVKENVKWNENW